MPLLVTGTIGIDTVETPYGRAEDVLGGSAVYFSFAASLLAPVRLVGVVGEDFLSSPSVFAFVDRFLVVGELRARLAVLDEHDALVGYLGENEAVCNEPGWPNAKDASGGLVRTPRLEPGKLNSPHGLAADPTGNLYVAEWLIGGRYTKLARV